MERLACRIQLRLFRSIGAALRWFCVGFFCFCFPTYGNIEVPRLGTEYELQLPDPFTHYTQPGIEPVPQSDPSHCSKILNPLCNGRFLPMVSFFKSLLVVKINTLHVA